jgi:hypothetical protein
VSDAALHLAEPVPSPVTGALVESRTDSVSPVPKFVSPLPDASSGHVASPGVTAAAPAPFEVTVIPSRSPTPM